MTKARKRLTVRNYGKQERSRETFNAVVEASIRIIKKDPDALTTNLVAEVAGISIGTLYQYFPNKQSILSEVLKRELANDLAVFREAFANKDAGSVRQAIKKVVDVAIEINKRDANLKRVLFTTLAVAQHLEHVRFIHLENVRLVSDYLRSAKDWDASVDPAFFSLMSLSIAASVFQLVTEYGGLGENEQRAHLLRLMTGYLAQPCSAGN